MSGFCHLRCPYGDGVFVVVFTFVGELDMYLFIAPWGGSFGSVSVTC